MVINIVTRKIFVESDGNNDDYMKIDNVYYAYMFRNLMHYVLTLNVMGDIKSVNGVYFAGLNKNEGYIDDFAIYSDI